MLAPRRDPPYKGLQTMSAAHPASDAARMPPQIKYIVGNEACERFSFYGMRSILVIFMTSYLLMEQATSKVVFHLFVAGTYLMPLFGAWISDRFLGKYRTILYLSLVYCAGHATLAVWENQAGLYAGLTLIAVGSGGIKPCVSAHVGDQFGPHNKHLLSKVFELFYWMINVGAFTSTLAIPLVRRAYGPSVAFGIPGILMAIATWVFWLGRKYYVSVPPTGPDPHGFLRVLGHALRRQPLRLAMAVGVLGCIGSLLGGFFARGVRPDDEALQNAFHQAALGSLLVFALCGGIAKIRGVPFLEVARGRFPAQRVEDAAGALGVMKLFAAVSMFWALFDQHSSSWVLQAKAMDRQVWGMTLAPDQIPALNPIMVMLLIPLFSLGVYPRLRRIGYPLTPLRRMTLGMFIAALSFVLVALIQIALDAGAEVSVLWQIAPYLVITIAEVFVSITGLEFAYTQAPRAMKSTIMSFWLLTVFFGNLLTAFLEELAFFEATGQFFLYAGLMAAVGGIFGWMAGRYRPVERLEE